MEQQLTRSPPPDYMTRPMNDAKYKYDLIEVQHMAGIIPRDIKSFAPGEKDNLKNQILLYDEGPLEVYQDNTLHDKHLYLDKNDIDYNLFKKQYDFLLTLSEIELKCLRVYTEAGFVEINFFHQNKDNKELIIKRAKTYGAIREKLEIIFNIPKYIEPNRNPVKRLGVASSQLPEEQINDNLYKCYLNFFNTMANIFKKCPKTDKEIRVFRGIKIEKDPGENFKVVDFYGFNSTSYDPRVAFSEDFYNGACCILDIKVKPGVPVLWISPLSEESFTQGTSVFGDKSDRNWTEKELLFFSDTIISTISDRRVKNALFQGIPSNSKYYTTNVYNVIIEPRSSRNLLNKWKTLSNKNTSDIESDPFKGSQQGTSRRKSKKQMLRKRKNNRKTHRK